MARTVKRGLEYLPLDVDFFSDIKISKLRRKCDEFAPMVFIAILCEIYKEGYYLQWDEDFAFVLAEKTRTDEDYVNSVILACLEVGLLDEETFSKSRVLTSRGIQRQYNLISEKSRKKTHTDEFSLLNDEINTQESDINAQQSTINAQQSSIVQQECNKEKKSKVKESKENIIYSSCEEEEEKIIYYFTFIQNWEKPNAECRKMIAYNNGPNARKKWGSMTEDERKAILVLWKQNPETKRFDQSFLQTWQRLYNTAAEFAPRDIRMDIMDDSVRCEIKQPGFVLHVTPALKDFLEENMDIFKPILWPHLQRSGCNRLVYKTYQPLNTFNNGKSK